MVIVGVWEGFLLWYENALSRRLRPLQMVVFGRFSSDFIQGICVAVFLRDFGEFYGIILHYFEGDWGGVLGLASTLPSGF